MRKRTDLWKIVFCVMLGGWILCTQSVSPVTSNETDDMRAEAPLSDPERPAVDDTVKILFIGNSLTYFNDMPGMVEQLAVTARKAVVVDQAVVGGVALRNLVNNPDINARINANDWDFVALQSDDITAFPDMYQIEINTLKAFESKILANNSSTKIIYLMVWGLRDGVTVLELNGEYVFYSYLDYMLKIYHGALYIADRLDLLIAPAGWAWRQTRNERPALELFSSDKAHPSYRGSYLTAAVYYSVIFKESCAGIMYNGTLSNDEAYTLRRIGSATVLDSLELWHLDKPTLIDEPACPSAGPE